MVRRTGALPRPLVTHNPRTHMTAASPMVYERRLAAVTPAERLVVIVNAGARPVSTNYWATRPGRAGMIFVSVNVGAIRLFVPSHSDLFRADCPPVGTPVRFRLRPHGEQWIEWLDGTPPFSMDVPEPLMDCRPPATDDGRVVPLVWYTQDSTDLHALREIRREQLVIMFG